MLATTLGPRVKALRLRHGMTLEALAQRTGLTRSFLSKVERAATTPSITTALKLAGAFGIGLGQLLGETKDEGTVSVLRVAERRSFMGGGPDDYTPLAPGRPLKAMEPFLVTPPLEFREGPLGHHAGDEFVLVLKGRMELSFDGRSIVLGPGDSAYFDASLPHRSRSLGGRPAQVLIVVAIPPDDLA
ncbi:MAG: family transcriptional regulator [Rubritepida sp.]|nr:family transcriptional regulator [Rubritepida sp.]